MRPLILLFFSILSAASSVTYDLVDAVGTRHRAAELVQPRATVFVFLATDCPISNRYSPLLHRLETEYRARHITFLAVFSDPATTAAAARRYLADYSLNMPGLLDPKASVARQTGIRVTPEVSVLSPTGAVLYRGRLDDRYVDWGKTRAAATQRDLRDALDSILANKPVAHPVTKALGCAIPNL